MMGAPTIGKEKPKGFETFHNVQTLQELFSVGGYRNGKLQNTRNFKIWVAKTQYTSCQSHHSYDFELLAFFALKLFSSA